MNIVQRLRFKNRATELGDNLCSEAADEIDRFAADREAYNRWAEEIKIVVERLKKIADVAERVCAKMEHPTASVTIIDQTDLRTALDALNGSQRRRRI